MQKCFDAIITSKHFFNLSNLIDKPLHKEIAECARLYNLFGAVFQKNKFYVFLLIYLASSVSWHTY
jgi:hypothetical protein